MYSVTVREFFLSTLNSSLFIAVPPIVFLEPCTTPTEGINEESKSKIKDVSARKLA